MVTGPTHREDPQRRPALDADDLVVAITPFEEPNVGLALAVQRAGGLGVLDLGRDAERGRLALADAARWSRGALGVRVPPGCPLRPEDLPAGVIDTVVLAHGSPWPVEAAGAGRRALVEVTSVAEARAAARAGASGIVARGWEAGGRVGDLTTFVLLQQLLADGGLGLPVWAAGGIGPHSAAAAVAGGAAGVVLDVQLALVGESELPAEVAAAVRAMDGGETVVVGGHRVYVRPDLPVASLAGGAAPRDGGGQEPEAVALRLGARDLRSQLLPIGQDGALARPLALRYWSAGDVVLAVRRSIRSHLSRAAARRPLAPGAAFASARSLRFPVAQGPMTRVSDSPAFAEAVAAGGGLPFLALALMTGEEVRDLLTRTAARLGERPWGVGILGFVPPEVREAQLEAILEARPPCALIAGGRPSQAAPLEAAGIDTFLHVPSPGLLDRFLSKGARKFVFEGSECGGHVGPRASFSLWDAQVERLLAFGERELGASRELAAAAAPGAGFFGELQVLFAGGIHDQRSAAMVAALAAPLADRGAGVGVLMGTPYLFTEELVAGGAVVPGFQRAALACEATVLLESSPGHVTRCADSAYAREFQTARRDLERQGLSGQALWAELERRNLGRLRVASKGLRREDGALVRADEAEQRAQGMYMMGQAAALRSSVTTVAELHEQVTEGATRFLEERAAGTGATPRATPDAGTDATPDATPDAGGDVAIVGMACVFPGADDLASYWANMVGGVDAVTEVPADRWAADLYYDPDSFTKGAGSRTPSKWGGFLPAIPFDPLGHGIPPASLASIEPVQLLALEVAARALADAGYADRGFDRERTSVIFGAEAGADLASAYGLRALLPSYLGALPPGLDQQLPQLTEDSFPGVLSNVIAGRIANRLDLGGVNYTVDAACASSLAALDLACLELRSGRSDMVLCGGGDTHNGIADYLLFSSVHALSPKGRCRPFDASADGIALGEGVACVVLKRLADAERDGDRIYAVVKAVAGSSDGRSLGLTAPNAGGQRRALERAYRQAGVSPARVGLVEAHGTGTVVGDRTELGVLTEVFTEAGAAAESCALGSVKSQIGHTKCAAGLAALVKTAYALHAGVRPPTLGMSEPNRAWERASSPFFFDHAARPWPASPERRFAGVSAFGFGGTNFHAVLASHGTTPQPVHGLDEWPAELFVLRGADRQAAVAAVDRLAELCRDASGRPWRLRDLARTVSLEGAAGGEPVQVALVASDLDDLAAKLERARAMEPDARAGVFVAAGRPRGKVAFLFPGQGSQRPGMLADLFVAFPHLQRILRQGERWAGAIFPPAAFGAEERAAQQAALTDTRAAQPALGLAGLAVRELLARLGVRPDMAGGHSYGELVALCAAGVLDEATLLELSEARATAILAAVGEDPGAMAAVAAGAAEVRAALASTDPSVVVANHNEPGQVVISGPTDAVEDAVGQLAERGLAARRLQVACAFHSPVVAGAAGTLAERLEGRALRRALRPPAIPVWSNATALPYPDDPEAIRATLARQVAEPVRFVEQVEAMYEAGARVFVEAGPGRVLTGLVGKVLTGRPHVAVACDVPGEHGLRRLLLSLAELATAGVEVDLAPLFEGRARVASATRRTPGWVVDGHTVRTADGAYLRGGLRPPERLKLPVAEGTVGAAGADGVSRDAAVREFLRTTRELVAAQRDVLLGYLAAGGAPAAPASPATVASPAAVADPATVASPAAVAAPPVAPPAAVAVPAVRSGGSGTGAEDLARTPERLLQTLIAIVGERTGYPLDMLDPDLDLEADLSIDSIKRTEVLGELADRLRLPGAGSDGIDEAMVEELAQRKTLRAVVDWISARMQASAEEPASEPERSPGGLAPTAGNGHRAPRHPLRRFVVRSEPLAALAAPPGGPDGQALAGHAVAIAGGGHGLAAELSRLLERAGAEVTVVDPGEGKLAALAAADTVVHLEALDPDRPAVLPEGFTALRAAALGRARRLLIVTGSGRRFGEPFDGEPFDGEAGPRSLAGAGLRGLARTLALELPGTVVRAVDVDPGEEPSRTADKLLAELLAFGAPVVVGHRNGTRCTPRLVEAPLDGPGGSPGAASAAAAAGAAGAIGLGPDSVILLTGGARGITAQVALGLARAGGCHLELVGRTPPPAGPEDPATAAASDRIALRRLLVERGIRVPAEVEAAASGLLAEREVRATLATLGPLAASVRYHVADVRDADALAAAVADVYARHGRLDGVVHGAGVIEDRLLRDKDLASFERVFRTKVDGARALAAALRPDLRFLVLFGSISGVLGNRGQADYAAANDALDELSRVWAGSFQGRVLALDWGPWTPARGGMVSPELERAYASRGLGTIDPEEGVACLLQELAWGDPAASQVVYVRAAAHALDPAAGAPSGATEGAALGPPVLGHAAVAIPAGATEGDGRGS